MVSWMCELYQGWMNIDSIQYRLADGQNRRLLWSVPGKARPKKATSVFLFCKVLWNQWYTKNAQAWHLLESMTPVTRLVMDEMDTIGKA